MINFTKSDFVYKGTTYKRYTGDRKRGGGTWVFYAEVPHDTVYDPTWPQAIGADATFVGVFFLSKMSEDALYVDFLDDLSTAEEDALDALYTAHVAPVAS